MVNQGCLRLFRISDANSCTRRAAVSDFIAQRRFRRGRPALLMAPPLTTTLGPNMSVSIACWLNGLVLRANLGATACSIFCHGKRFASIAIGWFRSIIAFKRLRKKSSVTPPPNNEQKLSGFDGGLSEILEFYHIR